LGSHAPLETLLPLPVAMLEVFKWKCPQLVCHDLLDVVHSSKMTTFEVEFEFWEKGRSHTDSDQVSMVAAEPLKYIFWAQNPFMEMAV